MIRQRHTLMVAAAVVAAAAGAYLLRHRFGERAHVTPAGGIPVAPASDLTDGAESSEAAATAAS
jgi:hypothetical protein